MIAMLSIVLGYTTVSIPPSPGDDWEIPFSSALLLSEFDFELAVHTADGHIFEVTRNDLTGDKASFRDSVSERARPGTLEELLEHPLIVMTPDGKDSLSNIGHLSDMTVLIGGFRVGELAETVHESANYRVSLGPDLLTVPEVIKIILEGY